MNSPLSKVGPSVLTVYRLNFARIQKCTQQAAACVALFNFYLWVLDTKLSCPHVVQYLHIGIGALFNKCGLIDAQSTY